MSVSLMQALAAENHDRKVRGLGPLGEDEYRKMHPDRDFAKDEPAPAPEEPHHEKHGAKHETKTKHGAKEHGAKHGAKHDAAHHGKHKGEKD